MGIPLFFRFITQKYSEILIKFNDFNREVDYLYFDMNGLIHPSAHNTRKNNNNNNNDLNNKIYKGVWDWTKRITEMVKPLSKNYLYVDGVAPLAKINQQRSRRYLSHVIRSMENRERQKYDFPEDTWDTNAISPGTLFMNGLMTYLSDIIENNNKFILSGSDVSGEGEHKILDTIKKSPNESVKLIYGLDADLIMLSLISGKNNIYLLREENNDKNDTNDSFVLLDIDVLHKHLLFEIKSYLNTNLNISDRNIIIDYIFICFLLGNDFIPNLPSLHINNGSIDYILDLYADTLNYFNDNSGIIKNNSSINHDKLCYLVNKLADDENLMVKSFHNSYVKQKYCESSKLSELDKEIRKITFLPLIKRQTNTIKYNTTGWEDRYYQRYLNNIPLNTDITNICLEYCRGLIWIFKYYLGECNDYKWFYPFRCAPTSKDLYYFLKNNNIDNIQLDKNMPLTPLQQLLCILPPSSIELFDKKYHYLLLDNSSPIYDLYPNSFNIEMLYKRYIHESKPILPTIDLNRIFSIS